MSAETSNGQTAAGIRKICPRIFFWLVRCQSCCRSMPSNPWISGLDFTAFSLRLLEVRQTRRGIFPFLIFACPLNRSWHEMSEFPSGKVLSFPDAEQVEVKIRTTLPSCNQPARLLRRTPSSRIQQLLPATHCICNVNQNNILPMIFLAFCKISIAFPLTRIYQ